MPEFLEKKLDKEYPNDPKAKYKIMNSIGAMKGNKVTRKGMAMQRKHDRDVQLKSMRSA
jgi:hypothetical protein